MMSSDIKPKYLAITPKQDAVAVFDGTRELVIPRTAFLLIYRIDRNAQKVEILRLLHGAEQWPPKR